MLNVGASYREVVHENGSTVIFLPLAHVLARGLQFVCLNSGMSVAHLSHPTQVIEQLVTLRPTFLVVVPRVLEKIQQKVAAQANAKKLGALRARAEATAQAVGQHRERLDLGQVKKFELVEVDATDPSLVTPTQKLKRTVFAQRWASAVESMYR